jgi:hypothetical protein
MGLLLLGGIFIIGLLYYFIVISPGLSKQKSLIKYMGKREADLAKMIDLKEQWERFEKSKVDAEEILAGRGDRFTLLSFLEGISREIGIASKIQYIKPVSHPEGSGILKLTGMEMKLDDININELLNFLYKVEYSGKLTRIHRIKIQRATKDKDNTLKVTLQVNTYT